GRLHPGRRRHRGDPGTPRPGHPPGGRGGPDPARLLVEHRPALVRRPVALTPLPPVPVPCLARSTGAPHRRAAPAGAGQRLPYFLCTACLVTPIAWAICAQARPATRARRTW